MTYPRSLIDEKLGSPIVARRAGDWEFHYFNGLLAWCGADIDTADEPSVLVGRHFTSRGQPMFKPNAPRSQLEEILGPPTWQSKPVLEYLDEDRKAILTLYFGDSESLRKVAISRFRLEENTYFGR